MPFFQKTYFFAYYLNVFLGYPYIFNLGHGVLPETDPSMIEFIVRTIREKNI